MRVTPLWQRRLHTCARGCGWTVGVSLIVLAVLAALTQLLLPLLARQPAWVASQLSERLQRPVSFASMRGRWTPSGPLFELRQLSVGAAEGEKSAVLLVPEAELKLDFGGWLLPSRHLLNLHLRGLQLDLAHGLDGRWQVNGIGVAGGNGRQSASLGHFSVDLWLEDLRVEIDDARRDRRYSLLAPQLRLSRQGSEIRFGGRLRRQGAAAELRTAGRFRDDGSAGKIWLGVDDVALKPLLDGVDLGGHSVEGQGRLAAWLDWQHGRVTRSVLRLDLDHLIVHSPAGASANVAGVHGLLGMRRVTDGYDVRWAGDDNGMLAMRVDRAGMPAMQIGAAARNLQIAPWLPWLALQPKLPEGLAQWVGAGRPRGELNAVELRWNRADGLQALHVDFSQLGIDPVGKLPGLTSLQGHVDGDAEALALEVPAQATTIQFSNLFRQPWVLSNLSATLALWSQDGDWHLGADTLDFVGAGYAGQARGELVLHAGGGPPFVELYANLDHADVTAAKLFWPVNAMPASTVAWLDRALVAGRLDQAQVLLRGELADWPFRHNEGRFEARAPISDLTLDYGGGWPRAEGISAVANFVDNGLFVQASGGHSLNVNVEQAVALIPDFAAPLLDLNAQGNGSGAGLMEFVRKSPIGSKQADTLAKLRLGGSGSFQFHLAIPLKDVAGAQLDGTATLKNADLDAPEWKLQLGGISGPLHFNLHGMQSGELKTAFRGQPSVLQLAMAAATGDPDTLLSASLKGNYRLDELVQDYPSLAWIGAAGDGRSSFTVGYQIRRVAGSAQSVQTLGVESSLVGIGLKLPAPLDKPAAGSLPVKVSLNLPVSGSDLKLSLGTLACGRFRLSTSDLQPLAGTIAFGSVMPTELPASGLRVRGHATSLDVTGWVQHVVAGSSGKGGPALEGIDVSADQTQWFGHPLGAMTMRVVPQADQMDVDVNGAAMAGKLSVPTRELRKRGLTARLQRLYWPTAPDTPPVAGAPLPNPANTGVDPASLPPLHMWVGDLRLGDAKLGEARLESWPTANGMHIEQLRALSSKVQVTASGDWNGSPSDSHSQMKIAFAAENLGDMLTAFGFNGLVTGGKTQDRLDASWPGPPSALSLANMDGTLSIQVRDGRIPEATSPGVGRLLGLVSLAELPRRLSLDFGDVFGKGLGFDAIDGEFVLANGDATTGKLVIKGPAAVITISGRTGLRARDYDQQVLIVPHVGNSLPVVGAVVAGPIGVAAGLAVQGLLGKGFNKAASSRYHVTGTWDKPVFTEVEKHGGAAPAAAGSVAPAAAASASE